MTDLRGGICPTCRWAADHGHPHPCITNPEAVAILEAARLTAPTDISNLVAEHLADPLGKRNGRHGPDRWQPADRTWCTCQCSPTNTRLQDGGARS